MIAKKIATLLAAVAVAASGPAVAQATAPVPAQESALEGSQQMEGASWAAYAVAAVIFGGLIYGFIEFLDDDDGGDVSVSPS